MPWHLLGPWPPGPPSTYATAKRKCHSITEMIKPSISDFGENDFSNFLLPVSQILYWEDFVLRKLCASFCNNDLTGPCNLLDLHSCINRSQCFYELLNISLCWNIKFYIISQTIFRLVSTRRVLQATSKFTQNYWTKFPYLVIIPFFFITIIVIIIT